ncbi:uncharacterized protein MYCGRDRAFT_48880 [Zymoseptoria tritici IPO323]|uniref:Large ribosomal subunit protein mL44 n=1 Tax=Zymoseptoria tritici (strain CBS 115943 / IPO323) TaxID=336722 RepID=F9XL76_ZYMTI|nr:uncharacterized protein MYCGRDRAFT_48880 [Zymoseptoria tritici IPO323]EGP83870.1 hypothetical protein MYCGRDRAFT_48880 [Zymoseptoria tritici IPO323]
MGKIGRAERKHSGQRACSLREPFPPSTSSQSSDALGILYRAKHTLGISFLNSLCALNVHAIAAIPVTTPPMIQVFVFQFAGCEYQPPAGDQTCLGNPRLHLSQRPCPSRAHLAVARPLQQRRGLQTQAEKPAYTRTGKVSFENAEGGDEEVDVKGRPEDDRQRLNFPHHGLAARSAKLSALHARLSLPSKLPLQTLARCLIDPSVDSRQGYNNAPFAILGQELLGYYTSEYLICHYPRLPMPALYAAQYAYVGAATLASMSREWGVEVVAAPGPEVDPGLLQLKRQAAGNAMGPDNMHRLKDMAQGLRLRHTRDQWNRPGSSRTNIYGDEFGDILDQALDYEDPTSSSSSSTSQDSSSATVEAASASFVRALTGALHLHAGSSASKSFHKAHVLSRHLALHQLFSFTHPTRDLSRLCLREGFEPPVARLISETGRLSRTPVFNVGVFSGDDKLGEAAGASLNEARVRASAHALRSWYLYSPPRDDVVLPSDVEGGRTGVKWKAQMVDPGEIIT